MKALVILGAIVGFLIGIGFGVAFSVPWPVALWRSCAGALVAAVLARWWSRMWVTNLADAVQKRHQSNRANSIAAAARTPLKR